MTSIRDPGLQAERTSIAWTRTCTALIAVGLIGTKLHTGALPILISLLGLLSASGLMLAAARRGRQTARELLTEHVAPAQGLAAVLTGLVLLLDVVAIAMITADSAVLQGVLAFIGP